MIEMNILRTINNINHRAQGRTYSMFSDIMNKFKLEVRRS